MTLSEIAYKKIKEMIIKCELEPGQIISENFLTEKLEMSRTPVRSGLILLEKENLLKIIPKKGIRISDITPSSVQDPFELRVALETFCIERYGINIDHDKLMAIYEEMGDPELSLQRNYELDHMMHALIVESSKNQAIIDSWNSASIALERCANFVRSYFSEERGRYITKEHREIIFNLLTGNFEKASQLTASHILDSMEYAIASLLNN